MVNCIQMTVTREEKAEEAVAMAEAGAPSQSQGV